ncbi:MAG: hypothetical protein M5U34_30390 [Chloroflexi bacterium]|nr:hypothetical protein [Chloroflexota bacterium]
MKAAVHLPFQRINVALLGQKTAVLRTNLDGSQAETVIRFPAVNTASEFAFYPWLQWLDGGAFAQAALSSPEPYTKPEANLWRIPATGKAESLITLPGNIIFSPVIWSDSGEQAGYIRQLTGRESALVIGAGDGQNMTPYGDTADHFFGWNPAGKQFVYTGPGTYAIGQTGEEPLLIDMAEGKTAVAAQWLNDKTFIIALGSADNWDFRWQTVAGPATRLISGSTTALFDIWSPPKTRG